MKRYSWSTDFMEWWDDGDYVLYSDHEAEISRLHAEIDAYRKDAERYRRFRDQAGKDRRDDETWDPAQLDTEVDAAMGAGA